MRYAIYFMPHADTQLWQFGCSVLGYDAAVGKEVPRAAIPLPLPDWTSEPRRYGFHATLKAPFTLAERCSEEKLLRHARDFADARQKFEEPPLRLVSFGGFIALALAQPSSRLTALADDAVTSFDQFRAPLTPEESARRLSRPLPPRQMAHLERWGYPHVFQDFTFHMTLSNELPPEYNRQLFAALHDVYAPLATPTVFDAIAVFSQSSPQARFVVRQRFAFGK